MLRPGCLARVVVGLVFLISGLAKMWVPGPFPAAVWRLVPVKAFHPVVVLGLPVLEVVLGLLLVSGLWQREVLRLVLVLACCFVAVRLFAFAGLLENVPCGCFGSLLEVEERVGLVLDAAVLGLSWFAAWDRRGC